MIAQASRVQQVVFKQKGQVMRLRSLLCGLVFVGVVAERVSGRSRRLVPARIDGDQPAGRKPLGWILFRRTRRRDLFGRGLQRRDQGSGRHHPARVDLQQPVQRSRLERARQGRHLGLELRRIHRLQHAVGRRDRRHRGDLQSHQPRDGVDRRDRPASRRARPTPSSSTPRPRPRSPTTAPCACAAAWMPARSCRTASSASRSPARTLRAPRP